MNSLLFYLICAILIAIIASSAIFFAVQAKKQQRIIQQIQSPKTEIPQAKQMFYNDFGRLRTFTKDEQNIPLVITPIIAVAIDNKPLYEEICVKKGKLQSLIVRYFNDKTKEEILQIGDITIKAQLKRMIDENLSMGQIDELYFDEFLFLD